MEPADRLESFGIYQLARQLLEDFWGDSEVPGKDYRGRELCRQQVRSLDPVRANMEEGYGRGFGKELPQHLKISRGEARESRGRYERCAHLLSAEIVSKRVGALDHIIGGLTKAIHTIEERQAARPTSSPASRHASPSSSLVTPHASPVPSPVTRYPSPSA